MGARLPEGGLDWRNMSVFFARVDEVETAVPGGARPVDAWERAVDGWRCGLRVVERERPAVGVSWVLAVAGSCLVVGVMGLARPVERVEAGPVVAERAEEEWLWWDPAAGGEVAEAGPAAATVETLAEAVEAAESVEALTAEDVVVVPEAVPVEAMVEEVREVREVWEERERRVERAPVRRAAGAARPSVVSGSREGAAGEGAGRSTQGAGAGGAGGAGGAVAGAGRGRTAGYFPTPPYPAEARRRGQQGTVQLQIVFGADGRVTSATVGRSSGFSDLDRAAAAWVRRHWRAATGQVGSFRLPVHFKLR